MRKRWRPLSRRDLAQVVGTRISEIRRSYGWRPDRLASMLEIPRPLLDRYERGEILVPTYTLYQLSGALDVDVQDLLRGARPGVAEGGPDQLDDLLNRLHQLTPAARSALIEFLSTAIQALERWLEPTREC